MTKHDPELSTDELRREMVAIDADHRQAMPKLRDALGRIFGGDTELSGDQRARAVLGMDRRSVLKRAEKLRGLKLAPAAVVARLLGLDAGAKPEKLAIESEGKTVGSCLRAPDGTIKLTLLPGTVSELAPEALLKSMSEILQKVRLLG